MKVTCWGKMANISDRLKATQNTSLSSEGCDFQTPDDSVKSRVPDNTRFIIPYISKSSLTNSIKYSNRPRWLAA